MKEVQLTRTFLKNPVYSVGLFLGLILLVEGLAWTSSYTTKIITVERIGGLVPYISIFLRGIFLPEVSTIYILVALINVSHKRFRLDSVKLSFKEVLLYQLRLLPTVLLSFFVFNPVTQTVRFFLESFPKYRFSNYWTDYLLRTFSWEYYFRYLIPIFVVGYVIINISLILDYLRQRHQAQQAAEAQAEQALQAAKAAIMARNNLSTSPSIAYLAHLKGKNAIGELDFPVEDVYYFTIEERYYYAELAKGRYLVSKTLNELETELDSNRFFRIKRDYIVNRQAVLNYAYWENGKYIVRLNNPDHHEIVVPRARMQEFREWLQGNQQPFADEAAADSLILV